MTRISTAAAYESGIENLQTRQRELSATQSHLTSGKKVERPSDDPSAAARAERAFAATARADADQRGLEASRSAMTLTEAALGDAGELLQQAREQMVSAGNGAYNASQRGSIAQQLQALRDQLLTVANRSDGAGGFVFAGRGSNGSPFSDGVGGVVYGGGSGVQQTSADGPAPLTQDGGAVWLRALTGNGVFETSATQSQGTAWIDSGRVSDPSAVTGDDYALQFSVAAGGATTYSVTRNGVATAQANLPYKSGQSITIDGMSVTLTGQPANGDSFALTPAKATQSAFGALDRAIAVLKDPAANATQVTQAVQFGLRDLDSVMSTMNSRRADAGDWLARLDNGEQRIASRRLQAQTDRSHAEDVDIAQEVSTFQSQQTSYDAALKSYAMVQRLSLMQYVSS